MRRVSVGESKLCHRTTPSELIKTRLPKSLSCNWVNDRESVPVDQIVIRPASVSIRLPVLRRVSFEYLPLTGWSRFAIQTTALLLFLSDGSLDHTAKQYAFSPTGKKPAEKVPSGEDKTSSGSSTDSDEPSLKTSGFEDENG